MKTHQPNPFIHAEDGPWMRRYLDWAQPYYERFPEPQRSEAAAFDRWLYSSRSIPALVAVFAQLTGLYVLIVASGARWHLALILLAGVVAFSFLAGIRVWLGPEGIEHMHNKPLSAWQRNPWLAMGWIIVFGFLASPLGFVVGRASRSPELISAEQLWQWLLEGLHGSAPIALAVFGLVMGVVTVTQAVRKQRLEARLARIQLEQERDAQAAAASKAQLKVLQAQIQPHFVFNTLAALQHWTDTQDPRASDLLKALTNFLRRSTDSMAQDLVTLKDELALVTDYLSIMQHRLGPQKLNFEIQLGADAPALEQSVPPAVLLSLVENAVEHGIGASLSGGSVQVSLCSTADQVVIEIVNTGADLPDALTEGVGLSNCRARLAAYFGDAAGLTLTRLDPPPGTLARLSLQKRLPHASANQ